MSHFIDCIDLNNVIHLEDSMKKADKVELVWIFTSAKKKINEQDKVGNKIISSP